MSDTPRTDALLHTHGYNSIPPIEQRYTIMCDHARTLERECAALRRDAERYRFLRDSQDRATDSDWPRILQDDCCALTGKCADEMIDHFIAKDTSTQATK